MLDRRLDDGNDPVPCGLQRLSFRLESWAMMQRASGNGKANLPAGGCFGALLLHGTSSPAPIHLPTTYRLCGRVVGFGGDGRGSA